MNKYNVGTRVLYTSPENHKIKNWFHAASMGNHPGVMHLNARDAQGRIKSITGVVGKVMGNQDGTTDYDFYPDGWVTPESGWPRGFQVPETSLKLLEDESLVLPGTLTNRLGEPL